MTVFRDELDEWIWCTCCSLMGLDMDFVSGRLLVDDLVVTMDANDGKTVVSVTRGDEALYCREILANENLRTCITHALRPGDWVFALQSANQRMLSESNEVILAKMIQQAVESGVSFSPSK